MAHVFWRGEAPWVLVRGQDGQTFAVAWAATDLPVPVGSAASEPDDVEAPLLSPAALQALARFLRQYHDRRAQGGAADA